MATSFAVLGISVPSFILAGLMQYFLAYKLNLFPTSGWNGFIYSILPALAIAFTHMGFIAKLTRSSMLEQNNSDYVKMARAKVLVNGRLSSVIHYVTPFYLSLLI